MRGMTIDLNADVGERPEALADGREEAILRLISSANIACGGHAGDGATMEGVLRLCIRYGIAPGAHPGYPDRRHFGRKKMPLSSEAIQASLFDQIEQLGKKAEGMGLKLGYVKPHGALYHAAATDRTAAEAVAKGVSQWDPDLTLVGPAGSPGLQVWEEMGFCTVGEGFADRVYESDGSLRSRNRPDALITDPAVAFGQALRMIREGRVVSEEGIEFPIDVKTLSVHSDTPNAAELLAYLHRRFQEEGITVAPFIS